MDGGAYTPPGALGGQVAPVSTLIADKVGWRLCGGYGDASCLHPTTSIPQLQLYAYASRLACTVLPASSNTRTYG